ncbi:MAG: hypothetical protein ABI723_25960 [Bacteroidia bacterium]
MTQTNKTQLAKKTSVHERTEKLDPNNNKNLRQKPLIKKPGKKAEHDDGFEHRTSNETTTPV